MHIDIDPILTKIPNCTFSHSNKYFANDHRLKQIGFAGTLDTDIYVQTSFAITGKLPVSGGLITTFTNDNMERENFLIYRMLPGRIETEEKVQFHLATEAPLTLFTMKRMLATLPLISLVIFNVFILLLPKILKNIFMWIGLGALLIAGGVYAYMGFQFVRRLLQEKKTTIADRTITYVHPADIQNVQPAHVEALKPLSNYGIRAAVIYKDRLYLKQELDGLMEQQRENMQAIVERTFSYLLSEPFTSVFV